MFFPVQLHHLPFTEQWSEYTQLISNAEASGAIQSKRAPLTFGPFTPGRSDFRLPLVFPDSVAPLPFTEQWSEYSQLISNAEASGAIQSKREPLTFGPFTPGRSRLKFLLLLPNSVTSHAVHRAVVGVFLVDIER